MLRLFKVHPTGGEPQYFESKTEAKRVRDLGNAYGAVLVVMRGPDHWAGESYNVSKRTVGRNSLWIYDELEVDPAR